VVSLVGGALALFRSRRAASGEGLPTGAGLMLSLVLVAACLGIYAAYAAPGLSIGVPPLAAVFGLPAAVVPGAAGRTLTLLGAAGLLVLFLATATALYGRHLPGWAGAVWTYPALAAAPLAWTASRIIERHGE